METDVGEDADRTSPAERPRPGTRAHAFLTGAAYGALALAGAVVGMVESFGYSRTVGGFPVAAVVLCLVDLFVMRLAGWGMGGKLGAAVPALTWIVTVLVFSTQRPEGDVIITADAAGYVYLLGGTLAVLLAVIFTPSTGSWLLAGAQEAPAVKEAPGAPGAPEAQDGADRGDGEPVSP